MEAIVAIGIVVAAMAGAFLYSQRSDASRAARESARRASEQARLSADNGLPPGDRPLYDAQAGPFMARDILDDGDAYNSPHVDRVFRRAYWTVMDAGGGMAEAFIVAMREACWARDSRKQVFDRLFSHNLISASVAGRLKTDADRRLPAGYGKADCSQIVGPDPGVTILHS